MRCVNSLRDEKVFESDIVRRIAMHTETIESKRSDEDDASPHDQFPRKNQKHSCRIVEVNMRDCTSTCLVVDALPLQHQ